MAKKRATKTKKSAKKPAKKRATATKPARKPRVKRAASTTRTRATKRRGPRSASERVAGLLLILPWLMKRKRVRLPEVARQFRMSEEDLVADLQMAAVCGVPPYTPDALVDVFVDDGWVIAEIPTLFSRPLRLT
ncbi:MAG: hypothetical protein ACKO8V_06650, partial [Actinomycetota bacterium]